MLRRAFVVLCLALPLHAAVDPAMFQDLQWRLIGPFRAGRVVAVTGVPGQPEHFYFGSVNGGVWETRDAGRTWQPIFDSQPIGSIGAIAVAPSNPDVIYVGSGEADMRSDIAQGDGMYKSIDAGKTWTKIGLTDSQQIGRVLVHPSDPSTVYVAALGHPYGPNAERGVYRSRDGGSTWQKILGRNDNDTGAIDLAFEPGNPSVIYAALWQTRRTPWSVYPPSNGPGGGLFKTTDGGDHWTELRNGLPAKPGRIGIALSNANPRRVYAIVDAEKGGMYRSDDAGATWTLASDDARIWGRGWYFGGITAEPKNADVVYSCNTIVLRSTDAGKTWIPIQGDPTGDDFHQLWIDPDHPERRILGVDQGTVVSVNGGKTWSSWLNQPTGQFYHVITDNRFPYWVYGAQQDSGAAGVPSRTGNYQGINLMNFREVTAGGESDNIAPDPKDPEIIYGGRVEKLDTRTQQTQSIDPTIAYPANDRRTWTLPLVFSPRDPKVLYFANQRLYRTDDGGIHWTIISQDLTREMPGTPSNLDPATAALKPDPSGRLGVIYAISPSRLVDHDIWVGTDDGLVWRTRDEGRQWQKITPPALTPWSKVGIIETSHFDAETAYIAVDRHRLDDFKPYIYRTKDGGKTWQLIANGLPIFVNVVREDPVRQGLLYAGTERGMYVSFDDGENWQSLQQNLPVTSIRDIDVHGNDLVIATHGRAFWIMDDVTPLRQTVTSGPFLFKPATAVRLRPAGFTGTPMPLDEPRGLNPPDGAYIDYYLPAASPLSLEITGDNGFSRRYSSDDAVPKPNPAKLRTAPEWFQTPSSLATTPGMHRFVWPIRMRAPAGLDDGHRGAFADGVWAPPGNYTLVLTVGSQRLTQPLVIAPDPRVKLLPSAYSDQFGLAKQIVNARGFVHAALNEARDLLDKPNLAPAIATKAREISEVAPEGMWWLAPKSKFSLRYLDAGLEKLADAVDGADAPPTPDARAGWEQLRPIVDAALRAWKEFKTQNATAFQ